MNKAIGWIWLLLIGIVCHHLGTGSLLAQRSTTKATQETASRETLQVVGPSPGGVSGCQKKVGILGNYFGPEMEAFLVANGLTVTFETAASIAGGSLSNLDVLYVNRAGVGDAQSQASTIEAWVRGGGVMITEFDATKLLFDGSTFGFFGAAVLEDDFAVPSGDVCGDNAVNVVSPTNPLAAGISSWNCTGNPIGVFKVYKESTLSPALERVFRVNSDQNVDGAKDLVAGTACMEHGAVVPIFTDFGDWEPLQDPRVCPSGACTRTIQDDILMLNAVCRVKKGCKPMDHFLCYDVRPKRRFKKRQVFVRNQFGDQYFTVLKPRLLCVPSTKELK